MLAKILAAKGPRRRSYDDQEGDNDINIILQPSDLQDIEKRTSKNSINNYYYYYSSSRTKSYYNQKLLSTKEFLNLRNGNGKLNGKMNNRKTNTFTNTNSKNNNNSNHHNNHNHDHRNEHQQHLSSTSTLNQTTIGDNQQSNHQTSSLAPSSLTSASSATTSASASKSTRNNQLTDLKLARSLLDHDYNRTVRLFIKKSALNWNFNSFTFDALCCGRSLTELLLHLFDYYDLYNIFKLEIVNVLKCFRLLEFGYHSSNPYHNSVHAADVTQAMHCFIQENKIRRHMTHLEILCSIMAAVCHDLDHPGVNQSFLVATKNPLASLYNNNSVLENHHWRFAICIFKESQVFDHFETEDFDEMKNQLKQLILATDIARQNEYLKRFRDLTSSAEFSMQNTDDRALVLQMALKCADLGNPCRPWLISRVWSNLICDEFYKMGRIEKRLGLPLTPICQREKTSIAGIQTDFFRFIVLPLLELWHKFLCSPLSDLLVSNFDHNYKRWQRAQAIVVRMRRRKSVACLEPPPPLLPIFKPFPRPKGSTTTSATTTTKMPPISASAM